MTGERGPSSAPGGDRLGGAHALDDSQRRALRRVLARWRESHVRSGAAERTGVETTPSRSRAVGAGTDIRLVDVEVLRAGRPGLIDVVAEMDGRLAHAVLGLRRPGDELRVVGAVEEPALGPLEDADGIAIAVDALHDADSARLLLGAVAGTRLPSPAARAALDASGLRGDSATVTVVHEADDAMTLAFDRRYTLSVFSWLHRGPHPGVTLLAGLDDAGFNHLPAPVAFWRRAGRDLGIVQELLAGATNGWALALTSLRDLFASGSSPDTAGGDFAPEAFALGTMAARMHIALDRAFGRRAGDVAVWVDALEASTPSVCSTSGDLVIDPLAHRLDMPLGDLLGSLRASGLHPPVIRTHGDFHLGRTARTDHGWVLADCMPGGTAPSAPGVPQAELLAPLLRSPLADVADFTWSLRRAAAVAAAERVPASVPSRVDDLASAWEARNRRAFVAAYLATPGIGGLVPADRRVVRRLLSLFELARAAVGGGSFRPVGRGP